jgi:hypothetical protein
MSDEEEVCKPILPIERVLNEMMANEYELTGELVDREQGISKSEMDELISYYLSEATYLEPSSMRFNGDFGVYYLKCL